MNNFEIMLFNQKKTDQCVINNIWPKPPDGRIANFNTLVIIYEMRSYIFIFFFFLSRGTFTIILLTRVIIHRILLGQICAGHKNA